MRRKKKFIAAAAVTTALVLSACGGKSADSGTKAVAAAVTEAADGESEENQEESPEKESSGEEQADGPVVYENFSGGTLYEEGDYLFRIDSMEMTDEGYVIQYEAETDCEGYKACYKVETLDVNGLRYICELQNAPSGYLFYNDTEEGQKGTEAMLGGKARLVITREFLDELGAEEVKSLHLKLMLGRIASNTIDKYVELEYMLYPGSAVEAAVTFPEPERESWLLFDNEHGRAQIVRAEYTKRDYKAAAVNLYIMLQQKEDDEDAPHAHTIFITRHGETEREIIFRENLYTQPGVTTLCKVVLKDPDIPRDNCEETFLSPVVVELSESGEGVKITDTVLDFTGLEHEQ